MSVPERITSKIAAMGPGCWLWTGYVDPSGYGRIKQGRASVGAHRLLYELLVAPIPTGGARKTHCPRGHPYDSDFGGRRCSTCDRIVGRRTDAKRRGKPVPAEPDEWHAFLFGGAS